MPRAHIVVGLGYGDEGKGSWVDYLVRTHGIKYVVRFNGGAQAAHNVVEPNGTHHTFAQFGSGTLVPETKTCLTRYMLIEPEALYIEAKALEEKGVKDPIRQLLVSENAPIITPFNRILNRIHEVYRGTNRHGSCGFGIGITQGDVENLREQALYMKDLGGNELSEKLTYLHRLKVEAASRFENDRTRELVHQLRSVDIGYYESRFRGFFEEVNVLTEPDFQRVLRENDSVFEGAQGVLLDQHYGFFPHCTRSNTTFKNALDLLSDAKFEGEVERTGLLRAYMTRHGAGPLVTEDPELLLPPCHNRKNPWQGEFRTGWFDAVAARYALEVVNGVDTLAITNLDRMDGLDSVKVATRYLEADPRFFNEDRIICTEMDYPTLAERTGAIEKIVPSYSSVPGWNAVNERWRGYLEELEVLLKHPIHAYSRDITHHKVLR